MFSTALASSAALVSKHKIAFVLAVVLFAVLATTGVSSAYWNARDTVASTVTVADAVDNCQPSPFLINGSFETEVITADHVNPGNVAPWTSKHNNPASTASNGIELWRDQFLATPSVLGSQFVEINANEPDTLMQTVATTPGQILSWTVWHRGRSGVDVMALDLGAVGVPIEQAQMSDGNSAWKQYSGTYVVPANQFQTQLSLRAVSTFQNSYGGSVGNLVDGVSFGTGPCLVSTSTVSNITDPGGVARSGDTLEYVTTVKNNGGTPAGNTTLNEVLPAGQTFVANSLQVDGVNKTTATGDDSADYTAGTLTLTGRLGDASSATVGGSVQPGETSTFRFRALVGTAGATAGSVAYAPTVTYTETLAPNWVLNGDPAALSTPVITGIDYVVTASTVPSPTAGATTPAGSGWVFTIKNDSPTSTVANSVVRVSWPAEFTATSVIRTNGNNGANAAVCGTPAVGALFIDCSFPAAITTGQTRTITVLGRVAARTDASTMPITATLTTPATDAYLPNNTATGTATVAGDTLPPTKPSLATTGTTTATQTTLSTTGSTDASGIASYNFYRSDAAGALAAYPSQAGTTLVVPGLATGTTYNFRVEAVDVLGQTSQLSDVLTVVTPIAYPGANDLFRIKNVSTGRCIDLENVSSGADVITAVCSASDAQQWKMAAVTAGNFKITPKNSTTIGWTSAGNANGARVTNTALANTPIARAQWTPVAVAGVVDQSTVQFINRGATTTRCLETVTADTQLRIDACDQAAVQLWTWEQMN